MKGFKNTWVEGIHYDVIPQSEISKINKRMSENSTLDDNYKLKRMYSEEELVQLLNFVSKEYNISNGIGWFHSHDSIEEVTSREVLDKWVEQFKDK